MSNKPKKVRKGVFNPNRNTKSVLEEILEMKVKELSKRKYKQYKKYMER